MNYLNPITPGPLHITLLRVGRDVFVHHPGYLFLPYLRSFPFPCLYPILSSPPKVEMNETTPPIGAPTLREGPN